MSKTDAASATLVDLNGDGLPDRVIMDGHSNRFSFLSLTGVAASGCEAAELPDVATSFPIAGTRNSLVRDLHRNSTSQENGSPRQ